MLMITILCQRAHAHFELQLYIYMTDLHDHLTCPCPCPCPLESAHLCETDSSSLGFLHAARAVGRARPHAAPAGAAIVAASDRQLIHPSLLTCAIICFTSCSDVLACFSQSDASAILLIPRSKFWPSMISFALFSRSLADQAMSGPLRAL